MASNHSPSRNAHPGTDAASRTSRGECRAVTLPVPVPLLLQLKRPLKTMLDVESLSAQLGSARARGCF